MILNYQNIATLTPVYNNVRLTVAYFVKTVFEVENLCYYYITYLLPPAWHAAYPSSKAFLLAQLKFF